MCIIQRNNTKLDNLLLSRQFPIPSVYDTKCMCILVKKQKKRKTNIIKMKKIHKIFGDWWQCFENSWQRMGKFMSEIENTNVNEFTNKKQQKLTVKTSTETSLEIPSISSLVIPSLSSISSGYLDVSNNCAIITSKNDILWLNLWINIFWNFWKILEIPLNDGFYLEYTKMRYFKYVNSWTLN